METDSISPFHSFLLEYLSITKELPQAILLKEQATSAAIFANVYRQTEKDIS